MKSVIVVVVTIAVFCMARGGQAQPIPNRPPRGFQYNMSSCMEPVEMRVFVDLVCPNSKAAWPTLMQVADYYNGGKQDLLSFDTLIFPLPYHRAAFPASQMAYILNDLAPEKMYMLLTNMFKIQAKYYNGAILNKTQSDIHMMLAADSAEITGVNVNMILSHFMDSDPSRNDEVLMWKYGCTRGVYGTPTAFVNGIRVDFAVDWTLADWRTVIDPLLKQEDALKTCPAGEVTCNYLVGKVECCTKGENCVPNVGCRC